MCTAIALARTQISPLLPLFVAIIPLDPLKFAFNFKCQLIDGRIYFEFRYQSRRFDTSFYWDSQGTSDGQYVAFRTVGASFFVKGGWEAMRAHRAAEFGAPLPAIPLNEQVLWTRLA
jgi:hypothetical protein